MLYVSMWIVLSRAPGAINVEKCFKKLLTYTFTRIFMSDNYYLFAELLRSSKKTQQKQTVSESFVSFVGN